MYQVYIKTDSTYNPKKLLGEYDDFDEASERAESEVEKDSNVKYIIEETTGYVDSYGELVATVVEKNF